MNNLFLSTFNFLNPHSERQASNRAIRRLLGLKPVLSYIEVHLTDHCNLNCAGCSHFCPMAEKKLLAIEDYKSDLSRLSQIFSNINIIRILGGEPLLHPNVTEFFAIARAHFPKANIRMVTNGILLSSMPTEFWESCRRHSIAIDLSVYPPLESNEAILVNRSKSEGVSLKAERSSSFFVCINSKGDTEPIEGFKRCRKMFYCPILKEGKVYLCAKSAYVSYFNGAFGTNVPSTGFIDLHDQNVDGWKVISLIEKPSEICRYCTFGWQHSPKQKWTQSRLERQEWDTAACDEPLM